MEIRERRVASCRHRVRSRPSPPSPEACLVHSRQARFHGGTLIVLDVHELAEHEERLRRPDGFHPATCPRCGGSRLHVHDHLHRILWDELRVERVELVRYICARDDCGATWRVLPAFVARHLWRRWTTVARTIAHDQVARRSSARKDDLDVGRHAWTPPRGSSSTSLPILMIRRSSGLPASPVLTPRGASSWSCSPRVACWASMPWKTSRASSTPSSGASG